MSKGAALLMLFLLATGCNFDKERQLSILLPARLVLKNNTLQTVHIKAVLSTAEAKNTFVLHGVSMAPGATVRSRIMEGVYDDIRAGAFIVHGTCGDRREWEAAGQTLDREAIEGTGRWEVTVSISRCDP